jgi:hypothetical protein
MEGHYRKGERCKKRLSMYPTETTPEYSGQNSQDPEILSYLNWSSMTSCDVKSLVERIKGLDIT